MRTIFMSFLMLVCLAVPATSFSKEASLFDRIKLANANVSVVKAAFEQSSKLALFNDPLVVTGELVLQKPQNLRWEYTSPSASGFILNKNGGLQWCSTGKNCSVVRSELSPSLRVMANQMLLWVNIDEETLTEDFHIKITESKNPTILLQPKDEDMAKFIKSIAIELPESLRGVKNITVTEANNSVITLKFGKTLINPEIAPTTFKMP
ncbi:LolA family protein [Halodesulfovibrio aestuarii]|uniref:LolA family protein n=1 Tax=Halodesulfovibrio aestuarii TaxID=126333 RepID=UPI003D352A4D